MYSRPLRRNALPLDHRSASGWQHQRRRASWPAFLQRTRGQHPLPLQCVGDVIYASTHQVFERMDAALWFAEGTPASWRAYADAAIRLQTDDRGAKRFAVGAGNTFRLAGRFIHKRNQAKTRSQVDSNCPWHMPSLES